MELGVLSQGGTLSRCWTKQADGLRSFKSFDGKLSNARSFAYFADEVSLALTGQNSFDIGPSGDVVDLRPIKIESATLITTILRLICSCVQTISNGAYTNKTETGIIPVLFITKERCLMEWVKVYPICTGSTIKLRIINFSYIICCQSDSIVNAASYEEAINQKSCNYRLHNTKYQFESITIKS